MSEGKCEWFFSEKPCRNKVTWKRRSKNLVQNKICDKHYEMLVEMFGRENIEKFWERIPETGGGGE